METSVALRLALGLLRAVGPLCITMLLLGMFKAWCSAPSRWKDVLAANAYGMYVAHIPIVVVLQYWLLPSAAHRAGKVRRCRRPEPAAELRAQPLRHPAAAGHRQVFLSGAALSLFLL